MRIEANNNIMTPPNNLQVIWMTQKIAVMFSCRVSNFKDGKCCLEEHQSHFNRVE